MNVSSKLTAVGVGSDSPLLTVALPASVLSVVVVCLPVLWASHR
jgi:hypothetical protein